jgi:hypothetical protein
MDYLSATRLCLLVQLRMVPVKVAMPHLLQVLKVVAV